MAQTTQTRARICLLGVSLTLLSILGVKSPENPNFWGVNSVSSQTGKILKVLCYRNYCIDFNQILHNDRPSTGRRWWSQSAPNKSKMADGHRFEKKPLNRHIYATV